MNILKIVYIDELSKKYSMLIQWPTSHFIFLYGIRQPNSSYFFYLWFGIIGNVNNGGFHSSKLNAMYTFSLLFPLPV